jgi:hypothetical protein
MPMQPPVQKNKAPLIIGLVLVSVAIASAVYFVFIKGDDKKEDKKSNTNTSETSNSTSTSTSNNDDEKGEYVDAGELSFLVPTGYEHDFYDDYLMLSKGEDWAFYIQSMSGTTATVSEEKFNSALIAQGATVDGIETKTYKGKDYYVIQATVSGGKFVYIYGVHDAYTLTYAMISDVGGTKYYTEPVDDLIEILSTAK